MSNNPDWKSELQRILDEHNHRHARLPKDVSYRTRQARAEAMFLSIGLLRQLGFDPRPSNLRGEHVEHLIWYWTRDERVAPRCRDKRMPMREEPVSAAYLQFLASTLRTFAQWIGKPGMVLPLDRYVSDPSSYQRSGNALTDKSWTAQGLDIPRLLDLIHAEDAHVGAQADLIFHLGLRKKEAIRLRPLQQVIPASMVPARELVAERYLMVVELKVLKLEEGTKGGRLRFIPLDTPQRLAAIHRAQMLVRHAHAHMGAPGKSLEQALNRFEYVMRKLGITNEALKVTMHGLRHQFANDFYIELAGERSPVRGGVPSDLGRHYDACMQIVRQLGHGRLQIAGAYLGPILKSRRHDVCQDEAAPGNSEVQPTQGGKEDADDNSQLAPLLCGSTVRTIDAESTAPSAGAPDAQRAEEQRDGFGNPIHLPGDQGND